MKEIKIQLDYLHGPVWKDQLDARTGIWSTGIPCIDNDEIIKDCNDQAEKIYESLYSFEPGGQGFRFNQDEFERMKPQFLVIIKKIISRLEEINDGSYIVIDRATNELIPTRN